MPKMILISLPVADVAASKAFYQALGFSVNTQFSDATSASMIWSEHIHVMLHSREKWRDFTDRPIPPSTSSEVGFALSCESREQVDAMNAAAAANGGKSDINPVQDFDFMYARDMLDPDGHVWGALWMDQAAMTQEGLKGCGALPE